MALRQADILFKGRHAGTLVETAGGGTRFTYAPDWTSDIACCFHATRREYEWAAGLHPFFQHLAPEGWLREQQARAGHVVAEDDLGLLLRYGADCIGAIGIRPPAGGPGETAVTEVMASPGRTVSGIQKKLLAVREGRHGFRAAPAEGPAPFIAKFNSEAIPTLVRNEALSLRWATAVLGASEVTAFTTGFVAPLDEPALMVTRFDRGPRGETLRLEDCAQILCKPHGPGYAGKYDAAYEDIAAVIRRFSVRPAIDLARFFRRLIVFALIGNSDAHLKNFSLLETAAGLRLSPAYDVVNTAIYERFDQTLALSLAGRKWQLDELSAAIFIAFGREIGLADRAVAQILRDLRKRVRAAAAIITPPQAEPPDGFVWRFEEIVRGSCLRILGD